MVFLWILHKFANPRLCARASSLYSRLLAPQGCGCGPGGIHEALSPVASSNSPLVALLCRAFDFSLHSSFCSLSRLRLSHRCQALNSFSFLVSLVQLKKRRNRLIPVSILFLEAFLLLPFFFLCLIEGHGLRSIFFSDFFIFFCFSLIQNDVVPENVFINPSDFHKLEICPQNFHPPFNFVLPLFSFPINF